MGARNRAIGAALAATLVVACGGSGGGGGRPLADADPFRPDAEIPVCANSTATIGRCELEGGGDCMGVPEEVRLFVPLSSGDPVKMVIGPQAALMFVLALQTTGIYPGDADNPASSDNPNLQITLLENGVGHMALYRARPYFVPVAGSSGMLEASGLFVVVEGSAIALDGKSITAVAELTDKDGVERCGAIEFTAERAE